MTQRFTHFVYDPSLGVDLLAGQLLKCAGCETTLYRDYVILEDAGEEVAGEPDTEDGQLALGRLPLPEDSEPAGEEQALCESCSIEAGLL